MLEGVETRFVETNGIRLHVATIGPETGPPIILLHGFPEFWYGWRHQMAYLAAAGYRVIVPDQRGYNLSEKPRGIAAYSLDSLALDIIGLIEWTGADSVPIVGHDWGAAVGWYLAARFPEKVARLTVLNVPYPPVMKRRVFRDFRQLRRSWYIFFFQLPRLPEVVISWDSCGRLVRAMKSSARAGTFSDADFALYRRAWSEPGALHSMVNWYRAAFWAAPKLDVRSRITVPTLLIWGAGTRSSCATWLHPVSTSATKAGSCTWRKRRTGCSTKSPIT